MEEALASARRYKSQPIVTPAVRALRDCRDEHNSQMQDECLLDVLDNEPGLTAGDIGAWGM